MEINQVIKESRINRKMTQEELAKRLNVSRSTISSWENGRSHPDLEMVLMLSQEFEISLDQLLRGDSNIVSEITKDTRVRKKQQVYSIFITLILLIVMAIIFYTQIRVRSVNQADIVSAERDDNKVVIKLKNSLFYKDIATMSGYDGENSDSPVEIDISRSFSPFSSSNNRIEYDFADIDKISNRKIIIINKDGESIYELK